MKSRPLGYVVSSLLGLLLYVAWIFCDLWLALRGYPEQFAATLGVLIRFAFFGGVVFLALILPWAAAVSVFPKARWSGTLYFTSLGAILVFVLGCLMFPLMPGPTFEDPTFFEVVITTVQRQGVCFALAGSVFGASYWFVSERHVRANKALGLSSVD
jgi:hypothetical protein